MTRGIIDTYFQSSLGQQCSELFSTADDRVFIRHDEAVAHSMENSLSVDDIIYWGCPEYGFNDGYNDDPDWEGEREFMRAEGRNRELTEDERIIYGL